MILHSNAYNNKIAARQLDKVPFSMGTARFYHVYAHRKPHGMGGQFRAMMRERQERIYPPTGRTFELNGAFFDEDRYIIDEWVEDAGYEFVYGESITREEARPLRIVDGLYTARKVKKTLTEAFCRHQFREAGYGLS